MVYFTTDIIWAQRAFACYYCHLKNTATNSISIIDSGLLDFYIFNEILKHILRLNSLILLANVYQILFCC